MQIRIQKVNTVEYYSKTSHITLCYGNRWTNWFDSIVLFTQDMFLNKEALLLGLLVSICSLEDTEKWLSIYWEQAVNLQFAAEFHSQFYVNWRILTVSKHDSFVAVHNNQ